MQTAMVLDTWAKWDFDASRVQLDTWAKWDFDASCAINNRCLRLVPIRSHTNNNNTLPFDLGVGVVALSSTLLGHGALPTAANLCRGAAACTHNSR